MHVPNYQNMFNIAIREAVCIPQSVTVAAALNSFSDLATPNIVSVDRSVHELRPVPHEK